jgi:hypothetical protein
MVGLYPRVTFDGGQRRDVLEKDDWPLEKKVTGLDSIVPESIERWS